MESNEFDDLGRSMNEFNEPSGLSIDQENLHHKNRTPYRTVINMNNRINQNNRNTLLSSTGLHNKNITQFIIHRNINIDDSKLSTTKLDQKYLEQFLTIPNSNLMHNNSISKKQKIDFNKKFSKQDIMAFEERAKEYSKKYLEKLNKKRKEIEKSISKQLTFHPKIINKNTEQRSINEFINDQIEYEKKKQNTIKRFTETRISLEEQKCRERPELSRKSMILSGDKKNNNHAPIFERLYSNKKKFEITIDETKKEVIKHKRIHSSFNKRRSGTPCLKHHPLILRISNRSVSPDSERMATRKFKKSFREITEEVCHSEKITYDQFKKILEKMHFYNSFNDYIKQNKLVKEMWENLGGNNIGYITSTNLLAFLQVIMRLPFNQYSHHKIATYSNASNLSDAQIRKEENPINSIDKESMEGNKYGKLIDGIFVINKNSKIEIANYFKEFYLNRLNYKSISPIKLRKKDQEFKYQQKSKLNSPNKQKIPISKINLNINKDKMNNIFSKSLQAKDIKIFQEIITKFNNFKSQIQIHQPKKNIKKELKNKSNRFLQSQNKSILLSDIKNSILEPEYTFFPQTCKYKCKFNNKVDISNLTKSTKFNRQLKFSESEQARKSNSIELKLDSSHNKKNNQSFNSTFSKKEINQDNLEVKMQSELIDNKLNIGKTVIPRSKLSTENGDASNQDKLNTKLATEKGKNPMLFVDIDIGNGIIERLSVFEGDTVEILSSQFALRHNLSEEKRNEIQKLLEESIKKVIADIIKEESKNNVIQEENSQDDEN